MKKILIRFRVQPSMGLIRWIGLGLALLFLAACGPGYSYEEFSVTEEKKGEAMNVARFEEDVEYCDSERDKYLNLIRGRQAGYSGSETGFLGCMHTRGWQKRNS